jgi:class 3 adenylate cyclase
MSAPANPAATPGPVAEAGAPSAARPPIPAAARSAGSRLGNVRHDLHNPLNDILGFSQLLQEEARAQEQAGLIPEFDAIHQAAGRLLKQINHTLDLEHLKANPGALDQLRQTASALLSQILATTESLSAKCALLAERTFGDDVARIAASTRNLMELMPAVLALVKPADLTAVAPPESAAERDTELTPAPSAQRKPTAGPTPLPPVGGSAGLGTTGAGSLLVVEDSEANRVLLTRRLRRQGYDVWAVENGRQALELLRARPFELALLDLVMPEMDGYQVLDAIKSDPHLRDLPVIMISGLDELESLVRCIQRGAEDYLPKPFDPVLLGARIGAALEKKRLRDQEQVYLRQLQEEQEKSERLLLNILPKLVAERMKQGQRTIADYFDEVTVLFADLVGFTALTLATPANQVVRLLNEVFSAFDLLADKHGLEKIKTSGDSYMAVSGLPIPRSDHAETVATFALDLQEELARCNHAFGTSLCMRVGINTGPVIAGVIGRNKFIYDLWGDTVNTASRMESHAKPGMIQVSPSTHARLQGKFELRERGPIEVKGKGTMTTYFLIARR